MVDCWSLLYVVLSFHQLAISAVAMLVIVLREPKSLSRKPHMYFVTVLTAVTAFWLVLLMSTQLWIDGQALGNVAESCGTLFGRTFSFFQTFICQLLIHGQSSCLC